MSTHLTDRMPEVRAGRGEWSPTEEAHLRTCPDCRREWAAVSAVTTTAPRLDVDRIAAGVLVALGERPRVLPLQRRRLPLALAAAASILLAFTVWRTGGDVVAPGAGAGSGAATTADQPLFPELDVLLDSELEVLLAAMEPDATTTPIGDVPRLGDLTDDELEQLLDAAEG